MRVIVSRRASEKQAASTTTVSRFETGMLTDPENLQALSKLNGAWVSRAMGRTRTRRIILDLDSSESPVHGQQEGSSYNEHFECVCCHPLFCFNQYGDCEGAMPSSRRPRAAYVSLEGLVGPEAVRIRQVPRSQLRWR